MGKALGYIVGAVLIAFFGGGSNVEVEVFGPGDGGWMGFWGLGGNFYWFTGFESRVDFSGLGGGGVWSEEGGFHDFNASFR